MRRLHILALLLSLATALTLPVHGQNRAYDLDITVDYDAGSYNGVLTVDIPNASTDPFSEIFFRLYPNDHGLYGDATIAIHNVTIQSGSLPFATYLDDTILMVPLPEALQPGDSTRMTIAFSGKAAQWEDDGASFIKSGYGILTKTPSTLTLTSFYPHVAVYSEEGWSLDPSTGFGDQLMGDAADYSVTLTIPSSLTAATSGRIVESVEDGEWTTHRVEAPQARDVSIVLFEDYVVTESTAGDIAVRAWTSQAHAFAGKRMARVSAESLAFLEARVGPSPYSEIDLVEVPLQRAAGVEFSGLILVSSEYAAQPNSTFFYVIIAHEIVHQWFYGGVGNDLSEDPWLDESLATFLSYDILEGVLGPGTADSLFDAARDIYTSAKQRAPGLSISSPRYAFPDSATYSSFVYSGGAAFLDDVRLEIGDEQFYLAMRDYYNDFFGKIATPRDLISAFVERCSCTLDDVLLTYEIVP